MNDDTKKLVEFLRNLTNTIEDTGIKKMSASVEIERGMVDVMENNSAVITWKPTLERIVTIRYEYMRLPEHEKIG